MTVFRSQKCPICEAWIPKQFEACSEACWDAKRLKENPMNDQITWNVNLEALSIGQHEVETHEGAITRGRITKVNFRETQLPGKLVKSPVSIELNNDASDFISWDLIKSIKRL